ncbi:MAG: HD-GYP domain-containing protein [Candidatus Bipolaricaulia bacterium]
MIYIGGPWLATWGGAVGSLIGEILARKTNKLRARGIAFNVFQFSIASFLGGIFFIATGGVAGEISLPNILSAVAAGVIYFVVNIFLLSMIFSLTTEKSFVTVWKLNLRNLTANYLALTPLGILLGIIYIQIGIVGVILIAGPLLLARYGFKLYMETQEEHIAVLRSLVNTLEAKDEYTKGHSERVAFYAVRLAQVLDLPPQKIAEIMRAGYLHDIGKIAIDDTILRKPGKLSQHELDLIREHPERGARMVSSLRFLGETVDIIRYHQEKYDGTGYPERLKATQIPMGARILRIADTYDAMTSNRPYRPALGDSQALAELQRCAGTDFDPQLVKPFVTMINANHKPLRRYNVQEIEEVLSAY